jgi:[glutamine synthetase] adenylyltransferase / [glutamine synthetase]-adenylyl-L-tyrosine phosphorylase
MKPTVERLAAACPGVPRDAVEVHLDRLPREYFDAFEPDEIALHVCAAAALGGDDPVRVLAADAGDGRISVTVVAFDYRSEFSLLTGALAGMGLNIESGDVFTYRPGPPPTRRQPGVRRRIVDRFIGRLDPGVGRERWIEECRAGLGELVRLLESGRDDDLSAARRRVNERVAAHLSAAPGGSLATLYPVDIRVDNGGAMTRLVVSSQDTPAFLYALSNALALRGICIEHVRIRTEHGRVLDELDVLDRSGAKITDGRELDRVRFSVLLTKQFTHCLGQAPDPFAALTRFEQLTEDVFRLPDRGEWERLFTDPHALQELGRILGASDFIWEDFLRTQHEALLPMLGAQAPGGGGRDVGDAALRARMIAATQGAGSFEERCARLNEWKDREILLIDLDHMLHRNADVRALAEPLTALAVIVVNEAAGAVFDRLRARHGSPRTVGGLDARYAVFGLGKFGGVALGYASDIELLFVYDDQGETDGAEAIENREFFDRLAAETAAFIRARREGVFRVDLRLRPYGNAGPRACSLEGFCRYYGPKGGALAYERLALTRLRAVGGDPELGARVLRLRDEFVYECEWLDVRDLRQLRERQIEVKADGARYNAKFSDGALVDLEYYAQILQVGAGRALERCRTPRIHEALAALSQAGVLAPDEGRRLTDAYYFLRRLINGLRMLRGNALDLFLPDSGSLEYLHLARRMGYLADGGLGPERQLLVEFETHTAVVRAFIEKHFGREAAADPLFGNIADLVLLAQPPEALKARVLAHGGFAEPARACANWRRLAAADARRETFPRLAVLAFDVLRRSADPDMALNNWERFAATLPDAAAHFTTLLRQPRRLEILLGLFAGSQFLADTLIRNPGFFDWVTDPKILQGSRGQADMREDLAAFAAGAADYEAWLNVLRRFRRREILRIGTRDLCLHAPLENVVEELSDLAVTLLDAALRREWQELRATDPAVTPAMEDRFCVIGLGKLGGGELNYSSDVDLLCVCDDEDGGEGAARRVFARIAERLRGSMTRHTEEGYVYRVDFRLRPHGGAGEIVHSLGAVERYYRQHAALWELQALLKARPVAGALPVGAAFLDTVRPLIARVRPWEEIAASVRGNRSRAVQYHARDPNADIKTGPGGIRDIEFAVQALQLRHLGALPSLWEGNTLRAVARLRDAGLLSAGLASAVTDDYHLLRRVEHLLQILEDRQIHELPSSEPHRTALAKRVLGPDATAESFMARVTETRNRIHGMFEEVLQPRECA